MALTIRKSDEIMMSLVHYFVVLENYSPIHVEGVKDEIWLENLDAPYRIIRISSNSIINNEQYEFDMFKVKHVVKQIKKKTLSLKLDTLNIYLDEDNKFKVTDGEHIKNIRVNSIDELRNNLEINKIFPNIKDNLLESSDDLELIINVTNDINKKTEKENEKYAKVFAPKKIIFTKVFLAISIIMYLIMIVFSKSIININNETLALFGANNIILVNNFGIWRLLSAIFLHANILHLFFNLYFLMAIGSQLETFIGKTKFVIIFLVSGIIGNLMSLIFTSSNVLSVGSSGALFGLLGALLYFGYHYRLYLSDVMKNQIIPIILVNLLIGFIYPSIDNFAHIGGLVGGYITAMALGVKNKSTKSECINGTIVLLLLVAFLSYIVFFVK